MTDLQARIDNLYKECAESLQFCSDLNRDYEISEAGSGVMAQFIFILASRKTTIKFDASVVEIMTGILDNEIERIARHEQNSANFIEPYQPKGTI